MGQESGEGVWAEREMEKGVAWKGRGEGLGVFGPKQMEGDVSPFFSFLLFFFSKPFQNSLKSVWKYFDFSQNHTIQ